MPGQHGVGCGCKDAVDLLGAGFLLKYIKKDGVRGLNELVEGSAKNVIKSYETRLDDSLSCCSTEEDPELIIHIPFYSPCKITSFHLIGGDNQQHPSEVKLYVNQEELDFSNIQDVTEAQKVELTEDYHGALEYPLKPSKFQNVSSLAMFFPTNFGAPSTQIFYIGLRGQGSNYQRKAVVSVYEARPNLADHQVRGDSFTPSMGL